jgi:hypothetical protein
VLKIDPANHEVSIMAEGTLPDGQWKWHGGLASEDGTKIIGFPNNAGGFFDITLYFRAYVHTHTLSWK